MQSRFKKRLAVSVLNFTPSYFLMEKFSIPDYQRSWLWTVPDQVEFILSIFDGIALDTVFLNRSVFPHEIIDGKHRILTLLQFMRNELRVGGLVWNDLSEVDKRQFENFVVVPVGDCQYLSRSEILQLYYRINYKKVTKVDTKNEQNILNLLNGG